MMVALGNRFGGVVAAIGNRFLQTAATERGGVFSTAATHTVLAVGRAQQHSLVIRAMQITALLIGVYDKKELPRWWTMQSSRAVRRDRDGRTSSPKRSAQIRRRQ